MKRIRLCAILAILLAMGFVSAQDTAGAPSATSVLQTARDKYNAASGTAATTVQPAVTTTTTTTTTTTAPTEEAEAPSDESESGDSFFDSSSIVDDEAEDSESGKTDYPYFPAVIGFVPGLSFPMGIYDTTFAVSAIGAVNGKIVGVQSSGVFSTALDSVLGIQSSGVFNTVENDLIGFQAAGVFNIVGGDAHGAQAAGVFNIVEGSADWLQAAGVFNSVGGTMRGVQAAGVVNVAHEFSGLMTSGVINIAGQGKGFMVGVVNIADSLDGVAIGLVNIIKDGIWDINTDYQFDSKTAYLTYRSGTPMLYAVAYAGQKTADLFETTNNITAGGGLGHRFKVLFLTVDTELCYEASPIESYYTAGSLMNSDYGTGSAFWNNLTNDVAGFGSVRMSFGFGKRKGFGVYMGIKTDFGDWGKFSVPDRFRTSFGKPTQTGTVLFDKLLPIWPKWFIGIRY